LGVNLEIATSREILLDGKLLNLGLGHHGLVEKKDKLLED
jgi:hypothetical protein